MGTTLTLDTDKLNAPVQRPQLRQGTFYFQSATVGTDATGQPAATLPDAQEEPLFGVHVRRLIRRFGGPITPTEFNNRLKAVSQVRQSGEGGVRVEAAEGFEPS